MGVVEAEWRWHVMRRGYQLLHENPKVLQWDEMPQASGKAIDTREEAQSSNVHFLKLSENLRDEFLGADNLYPDIWVGRPSKL